MPVISSVLAVQIVRVMRTYGSQYIGVSEVLTALLRLFAVSLNSARNNFLNVLCCSSLAAGIRPNN